RCSPGLTMVLPLQRFLDVDFMRINLATPTRSMAARAARPTSFLSCHRTSMWAPPPVGGAFWFPIFIQAPSPEAWRKSISGGEGGWWRGNGVACFWATSFGKNYRRRDRDRLVPPRWMDTAVYRAEVCYPSVGSTGVTSSEAARVHIACRRYGGRVAASGASATAGDACGRGREGAVAGLRCLSGGRLPPGLAGLNPIATVSNYDGDYCRRHPQATGRDIRCAGEKHGHFPLDERENGFTEGQNVALEFRWADGRLDRLPAMIAELDLPFLLPTKFELTLNLRTA